MPDAGGDLIATHVHQTVFLITSPKWDFIVLATVLTEFMKLKPKLFVHFFSACHTLHKSLRTFILQSK